MAKEVVVRDRGWNRIQQMFKKHSKGGGRFVSVGIQGSEAELVESDHGGMTNVELGAIQEYGTKDGRIPERPFLRSTFDEKQADYQKEIDNIAKGLFEGGTVDGQLMLLGEKMKGDVVKKVKSGGFEELKQATIDRRKENQGTTPLWATGQLMSSLSAEVVDRNEREE